MDLSCIPLPTLVLKIDDLKILDANTKLLNLLQYNRSSLLQKENVFSILHVITYNQYENPTINIQITLMQSWNEETKFLDLIFPDEKGLIVLTSSNNNQLPVRLAIEKLNDRLIVSVIECTSLLASVNNCLTKYHESILAQSSDFLKNHTYESSDHAGPLLFQMDSVPNFVCQSPDLSKKRRSAAVVTDINQKVIEMQKELRSMFDTVLDCMIVINDSGIIERANLATVTLFGYSTEELIGQNVSMLMPEPYRRNHDTYLKNYLNTGVKKIIGIGREVRGLKKNGTVFPMELGVTEMIVDGQRKFTGILRDMTQRFRDQERVMEVQRELKSMFDTVLDCLIVINDSGIIERANPATVTLFGYSLEELIGQNVSMLMPSPYRENHGTYLKNYLTTGVKKIIGIGREVRGLKKNGTVFPMELGVTEMIVDGQRKFTGILRDMTQRFRDQERVMEVQRELKSMFDTVLDCLIVINDSGVMERANLATVKLFGYSLEELIGQNVSMLMPSPYRENHGTYLKNYLTTGIKKIIGIGRDVKGLKKDGSEFPMELGVTEMIVDGQRKFTGILRDMTQRFKDQEQIMQVQRELKSMFDTVMDCVIVINDSGVMERANLATIKLFGYSLEELIGQNVSMLMPSPYRENHGTYLKNYLTTGVKKIIGIGREVKGLKKDGTVFPMELGVTEMVVGQQRKFTGILRDVTEKILAQQRLIDAERSVWEKNSLLFSFLSHELRTPLNGIIGMIEVLLDTNYSEEQHQYIKIINDSSNTLLHIINNILDHSKLEAEKMTLESVPFDLYKLCSSVVELQYYAIKQNNVELFLDYPLDVHTMFQGDPHRLRQVLLNIIGNAIKFTKEGYVSVKVQMENQMVNIQIQDTGIGMQKEQKDNLFNSLYQTKSSISKEYGGTGLGMAIAYKLIKLMRGEIKVDSVFGKGTTFLISIPLPASLNTNTEKRTYSARVLLLSNNEYICRFIENLLHSQGIDVIVTDKSLDKNIKLYNPTHCFIENTSDGLDQEFNAELVSNFPNTKFFYVKDGKSGDRGSISIQSICKKPLLSREIFGLLEDEKKLLVEAKPRAASGSLTPSEKSKLKEKKILVVDDNAINRKVITTILKKLGCETIGSAENGMEAFKMIQKESYHLVLLDLFMPGWDGFETCEKIRETNNVPIIALTAETSHGTAEQCYKVGMQGFLSKPIQIQFLIEELRKHLMYQ